ncbi:MAG: N-acetylmuramoyl-L-alanine amidase, partial [Oscillospiraceae bacterium]
STLSWWQGTMSAAGTDVAGIIYNSKLSSKEKGWNSPDQVLRQLIAMRDVGSKGVAFESYQDLVRNNENHTELITKFYKGQVKSQDILTDLAVSRPDKTVYSTDEPFVSFYGASDPNFPLLLNDMEVERNDKGVFSLEIELKAGENTFNFTHKTKTVTYNITRNIKIIQRVSPEGGMTVEGSTIVPISVYAYKDSTVVASVGGVNLNLVAVNQEGDDTDRNSSYILYTANYECPPSAASEQQIGNVQISATWQGITHSATGANIRVTALPPPEIAVGEKGSMVEVTAAQARTYPSSVLNSDPSGDCFPLPKGSRDFIASDLLTFTSGGVNYSYYILRSGIRINAADVTVVGETELVANNITEANVYAEGGFTYLKLKQEQPMAFKASLPGLGFDSNSGISSFTSGSLSLSFNQVASIPGQVGVSENNVFSSASIAQNGTNAVVTLNFHRGGRFAGYCAYYQDGYLIFRFTEIPSSLSGAKIYLDPGHGGMDPGTIPIAGMKSEATLNFEMATKVADILRGMGANVMITDSSMNTVSLDTRLNNSKSYAPHLFVSLHHNSSTSPSAHGTEAWFFNPYSEIYADRISSGVAGALGSRDRGEKYGLYRVTSHMEFPAILVEYGFLSNVGEYDKLKNPDYQNAMAQATADAIAAVFSSL